MFRWRWKWVVLWSLWAMRLVQQPTPVLRVSGGLLRGLVAPDGSHVAYLAVPYATVTPGNRFQAPGPEPKWEGVFDAVKVHIRCRQRMFDSKTFVTGQEDCLVLNVYTPLNQASDESLPVMVFIHGGAFFTGSAAKFVYGPDYLIRKKVILVTLNYRLNVQGFLCLGIKEAPGNAGMKDQVAALKWVQKNIRVFGGDPDNVTLFGESAGGASVSFHVLSPMSKGLFHKAITQSGSALAPWALQYSPVYMASLLAKAMLYDTQDPHELYQIFMNKTDEELVVARIPRKVGDVILSEVIFVPCVEKRIEGVEQFLTDLPHDLLNRGEYNKVPMIIGVNNKEGYFFGTVENSTVLPKISLEKSLPKDLVVSTQKERKEIAENLRNFYGIDENNPERSLLNLTKFHEEPFFVYPSREETELMLHTNDKPIYSYLFSYSGWRNFVKLTAGSPFSTAPGATHADDLFYLFKQCMVPNLFEDEMIDKMTTLWTNFAKYGDPTPEALAPLPSRWPRALAPAPHALVLDAQLSTAPLWHTSSLSYWRHLYAKHRRKL